MQVDRNFSYLYLSGAVNLLYLVQNEELPVAHAVSPMKYNLDLIAVANDFIDGIDHRKNIFGSEFKQSDYKD